MSRSILGIAPALVLVPALAFAQDTRTSGSMDPHAGHMMMEQQPAAQAPPQAAPVNDKLPADAAGALDALKRSSRHQEYVDVALPGSTTKIRTFVVYPESKDKAPVVLVIHEIFGLSDWVRGCRRSARKGRLHRRRAGSDLGHGAEGRWQRGSRRSGSDGGHPKPEAGGCGCAVERGA